MGDLTVQASIYAHRSFAVRSIYSRRAGTLVIYGSVAAGSITATEPRYATKIEFDERLASSRPPSFPLSDRYELEDWSGRWQLDPNDARFDTDDFLKADAAEEIEPGEANAADGAGAGGADAVATDAAVRDR